MRDAYIRWVETPAKWYQFWLPQSGAAGGVCFGAILFGIVWTVLGWLGVS